MKVTNKCFCEITYDEFRSSYSFKEIRKILSIEARRKYDDTGEYMFITRHTVLGRWRQLKLIEWNQFQTDIKKHGCFCEGK